MADPTDVHPELRVACAGRSPAVAVLRERAARVAPLPTTVLLVGETGTGKGVLARAIHAASGRGERPFVHVDCAGLPDGLLESELYGVARGAFTSAVASRPGRFETAADGTLFLDEIGELALSGQKKLLRVLEEGTYERVGECRPRRLAARVLAATHVDLDRAVREGRFRADLHHRLCVARLDLPPLRDRCEDLDMWIDRAAARAARRLGLPPPRIGVGARRRLAQQRWPGNLRELFHVVEAATIWADGGRVDAALVGSLCSDRTADAQEPRDDDEAVAVEIARAGGNLALAARRLGMARSTLRHRAGLDDAGGRMRRLRRRAADRPEAGPDESQRDQAEGELVELREA